MQTEIHIFSHNGCTPITNRGGQHCDRLVHIFIDCETPEQAKTETLKLIKNTPHAYCGNFYMPDYWNQNTRNQWVGYGKNA